VSRKIAVMGGFGGDNLGDELIGLAEAGFLRENGLEPLLYSFSPSVSQGVQPEVSWLDYREFPDYFQRLRNLVRRYSTGERQLLPDAVIIGAGGLLYDTPLTHLIGWHSRTLFLRKRHIPYALFANSLRRPKSALARYLLREVLKHAVSVSLRDRLSLDIARELYPRDDYRLGRDPVLSLGTLLRSAPARPAAKGRIAVVPRPWAASGKDGGLSFWQELLEGLVQQGLEPVLVAFDSRMDIEFCERLRSSLALGVVRSRDSAGHGLADAGVLFDDCEMIFGMRFHALILALLLEKPMLAFSYDEKVTGLMADLGMSSLCYELDGDAPAALAFVEQGVQYLRSKESEVSAAMREYVEQARELTVRDFFATIEVHPQSEK